MTFPLVGPMNATSLQFPNSVFKTVRLILVCQLCKYLRTAIGRFSSHNIEREDTTQPLNNLEDSRSLFCAPTARSQCLSASLVTPGLIIFVSTVNKYLLGNSFLPDVVVRNSLRTFKSSFQFSDVSRIMQLHLLFR